MRSRTLASAAAGALLVGLMAANPVVAAPDDTDAKPYVVMLDELPAIAYDGGTDGYRATKPGKGNTFNPNSRHAREYIAHLDDAQQDLLDDAGVDAERINTFKVAANGFAAELTDAEAATLRAQKGVMLVVEDELQQPQTDVSPEFLGLTDEGEAWLSGYDGEGVVVGVIDSGIWPEHASFADDGSYERPDGIPDDLACDFGQTELPGGGTASDYNPDDLAFECNNKLLGARDMLTTYNALIGYELYASARDADGHGTHTAGTAAGNADVQAEIFGIDRGSITGIAPRASVIAYKGLGDLGGFSSDLAGAIDQAVADGVDVINYSIGSSSAALGPDDIAFLFAADAGVHVATSNGNSGPGAATIGSPAVDAWVTSVGASTHTRGFENEVTLGDGTTFTGVSITEASDPDLPLVDAADLGNELCDPDVAFSEDITDKAVLCLRGVFARVDKSLAVHDAGGVGMVLYNPAPNQSLVTDNHWVPSTHVGPELGADVAAYIDDAGTEATITFGQAEKVDVQGWVMADFSSRGPLAAPAAADMIKPDVTGPGVNILAGNTPTPTSGRPGQLFQSISGTSMSSPHVAGLMALLDQAHADWSPASVKSALMTTARQDVVKEDGTTPADPFDMGAGHVDPGKPGENGSMFKPGIVYDAGFNDYLAFLCGTSDLVGSGTCAALADAGYSDDPSQLNLASLADAEVAASTTLSRTVTNVSGKTINLRPEIESPDGFDVSVSPEQLTIPKGRSASYEVTITNVAATPEAWVFGSLTWSELSQGKGKAGITAYSPIAVRGAELAAPAAVTGTGADGSTSFEVSFGYTGQYTAAPHGMVADDARTDTVVQDPDQNFSAADGYSTPVEFTLDGAAYFRIAMGQSDVTGPGADVADLDLFLEGPGGAIVASSTSGATDEFIELTLPDNGTYTLWVHGWQTGGEELGFTAHSWAVPLAPGGSLSLDSAPTEAVAGTTGAIEVSWSGASAGRSLGAVSHSDGDGLIGLTLVEVDN